jgi:hypothetical protein
MCCLVPFAMCLLMTMLKILTLALAPPKTLLEQEREDNDPGNSSYTGSASGRTVAAQYWYWCKSSFSRVQALTQNPTQYTVMLPCTTAGGKK